MARYSLFLCALLLAGSVAEDSDQIALETAADYSDDPSLVIPFEVADSDDPSLVETADSDDASVVEHDHEITQAQPHCPYSAQLTGMTCHSNDWVRAWRTSTDCTAEILQEDLTRWANNYGIHMTGWAQIDLPSPKVLASATVYYHPHQTCPYDMQYSADGSTWQKLCTVTSSRAGKNTCSGFPTTAVKHIRVNKPTSTNCRWDRWFRMTGITVDECRQKHWLQELAAPQCPHTPQLTGMTCHSTEDYAGLSAEKTCTADVLGPDLTKWATGLGSRMTSWTQIDLPSPKVLSSASVYYSTGQTTNYEVQYTADGSTWLSACNVTTSGVGNKNCAGAFPPVTVSKVRIYKPAATQQGSDPYFRLTGMTVHECQQAVCDQTPKLSGLTCVSNNWHGAWRKSTDCTSEILGSDLTRWGNNYAIHMTGWAQINIPSPKVLSSVSVYYWGGQSCPYRLQYSADGSTWHTACLFTSTGAGRNTCSGAFPGTPVSHVRVWKSTVTPCRDNGDRWFRLTGIAINECQQASR